MKTKHYLIFILALLISKNLQAAALLTVTTLTDVATGTGTSGSLRYLMGIAQSGDMITFDSGLSGSIVLNSSLGNLPTITIDNLSIIGQLTTVPGVTIGTPKVSIDGINLPADPYTAGLEILNSNTNANYTISNLSFINFAGNGFSAGILSSQLSGTINISNCFFGTTNGSSTGPNNLGLALIQGSNTSTLNLSNSIITASTGAPFQAWNFYEVNVSGCLIGGNQQPAIDLQSCNNGSITNNLIGVTADGLSANPNGNGISLLNCNNFTIGGNVDDRNVCSGNGNHGIQLMNCSNCTISYNYLGTNIDGTAGIANVGDGCSISCDITTVSNNIIINNNLISGNHNNGIRFATDVSPSAITNCTISGNLIGTNAAGTSAIANSFDGIVMNSVNPFSPAPPVYPNNQGSISNNFISNNLISGNSQAGIRLANNATNNYFSQNKIGTQIDGVSSLPNISHGIFINSYDIACNSNIIGADSDLTSGIHTTYGNIIAYNGGNGINITPVAANPTMNPPSTAPQTNFNSFLKNSIFSNQNPQINLASGQNNNQAAPTINQAVLRSYAGTSNTIYVAGVTPNSLDASSLRLDFFATPASFSATNPQGETYLGSIDNTIANSSYQQLLTGLPSLDNSYYITSIATAYDNTGSTLGDSSTFSSAINLTYDTAITLGTLTATPNPINLGSSTTLSISFSGGTTPYTIEWSDGHTVFSVNSSTVTYSPSPTTTTSYYVNIIDALGNNSGSSNTVIVNVNSGPIINSINASPTQLNYGQASNITTNFSDGIAPYTASWNDYVNSIIVNTLVVSGITSPYIRNVTPNLTTLYSLTVEDSQGLSSTPRSVTISVGPHITSFTASSNPISLGDSTNLNVSFIGGTTPLTATWYANGTVIAGATSTSSITVSPTSDTTYYVEITDKLGLYSTSNTINIVVDQGPTITSINASPAQVNWGQDSDITVNFANGIAPYTANWNDYVNGIIVNNLTVSGITAPYIRSVTPNLTTLYSLQINDDLDMSSPAATVTIPVGPHITSFTADSTTIGVGQSTNLNVSFEGGTAPFSATWYANGTMITGATSTTSITISPTDNTTYYVTITDSLGLYDTSSTITITVDQGTSTPILTAVPTNITIGQLATLSATFNSGIAPYNAAWSNGQSFTNVTSPVSLIVSPTATTDYHVEITDAYNVSKTSNTVSVTINGSPTISALTASPSLIAPNQTATIMLEFDPGSGPCTINWGDGSTTNTETSPAYHNVAPASTTTYSVTITNDYGYSTQTVTVNVITPPNNQEFVTDLITKYYGKI